jgi:broad specificity phosphatase PhoE
VALTRRTKPPTRILIARHGQTVTNREGRFCGHSETDLTPLGIEQARALCRRLAGIELHAAYTSDFSRAIETARFILHGRDIQPAIDPALREFHYGEWELQKEPAVRRRYPDQYRMMRDEHPQWQPPGGETLELVRARTFAALQRIIKKHRNRNVLVITHGTAINCMLSELLGTPLSHVFRFQVTNCALSEVTVQRGRPVLTLLNDTSHLAGLESPPE